MIKNLNIPKTLITSVLVSLVFLTGCSDTENTDCSLSLNHRSVYAYDDLGRQTSYTLYDDSNEIAFVNNTIYNDIDSTVTYLSYNLNIPQYNSKYIDYKDENNLTYKAEMYDEIGLTNIKNIQRDVNGLKLHSNNTFVDNNYTEDFYYQYDSNGSLIKEEFFINNVHFFTIAYEYNNNGLLTNTSFYDPDLSLEYSEIKTYNDQNKTTLFYRLDGDSNYEWREEYYYDENGVLDREVRYVEANQTLEYDYTHVREKEIVDGYTYYTQSKYDHNSQLIEQYIIKDLDGLIIELSYVNYIYSNNNHISKYEYSDSGKITYVESYKNGQIYLKNYKTYDENDRLLELSVYSCV